MRRFVVEFRSSVILSVEDNADENTIVHRAADELNRQAMDIHNQSFISTEDFVKMTELKGVRKW
jgi:hypothetical protein